jgi:hypothetical protein
MKLTPQELEYLKAHEDEIKRDQQIADLISSLTNKTNYHHLHIALLIPE